MKKPMTIDELADLIISTMASKEDVVGVKKDLAQFKGEVTMKLGEMSGDINDLQIEVQKINNKMSKVEDYKIMQLELIKLFRKKEVISPEELQKLLNA